MKKLTPEDIEQSVKNSFSNNDMPNEVKFIQGCATNGAVLRTSKDPNLCCNPLCTSCTELKEVFNKCAK